MHMFAHTDDEKTGFRCKFCNGLFKDYNNHARHVHTQHTGQILNCKFCDYQTRIKYELKQHELTHTGHPEGDYLCEVSTCDAKFPTKRHMTKHLTIHHKKATGFDCDVCGQIFVGMKDMKHHKERIHGEKNQSTLSFQCHFCDQTFRSITIRADHELEIHGVDKKTTKYFSCPVETCEYKTLHFPNYKDHLKIHEKRSGGYACKICGARIANRGTLSCHIKRCHSSTLG